MQKSASCFSQKRMRCLSAGAGLDLKSTTSAPYVLAYCLYSTAYVIAAGFILLSYHMCENCTFKIKEDDSCPTSVQKQKKTKTNTNSHTFCIR